MMQIKELFIYGKNGALRRLPFSLGKVNIIPGKSKTGKSAVGAIIDYCLGGTSCNIADGVVRDNSDWYALLLQFTQDQVFVARKNPPRTQQSTGFFYVQIGKEIEIPLTADFESNHNVASLEEFLSRHIGISENLHIPPDGQSRQELVANIRHALFYCFQNQDEVASPQNLFHRQQESFLDLTIKDTLPYFLGVVNEDSLALEQEKIRLKREIAIEGRRLNELISLQGSGIVRAVSLISEAKEVGLLDPDFYIDFDKFDEVKSVLETFCSLRLDDDLVAITGTDRLTILQLQLEQLESDLEELNIDIIAAKNFAGAGNGYENAARSQAMRLSSIGLFEHLDFDSHHCPFCSGELGDKAIPSIASLKMAVSNLDAEINTIERERPRILEYLNQLENKRMSLRDEIRATKAEIDGIYQQNEDAHKMRDLMTRRAHVIGRISLWLDSMKVSNEMSGKKALIDRLQRQLDKIEVLLNRDDMHQRMLSALNRISVDMSRWAKLLELEHGDNPYRLDMTKVTVMVDRPERPIPLRQLGSGSNWVGVHLITYMAMQKFFIEAKRPVPQFVFIDQPSQVYFPSETEEHGREDWDRIRQLYGFLFDRVEELHGELQLIIVDHASLDDDKFSNAITEDWLGDGKLIPADWYETTGERVVLVEQNFDE
jgi:hypothetical protein